MHVLPLAERVVARHVAERLASFGGLAWLDANGIGDEGQLAYVACAPCDRYTTPLGDRTPLAVLDRLEQRDSVEHEWARAPRYVGYIAYDATWSGASVGERPRASGRERTTVHRREGGTAVSFARYDACVCIEVASGRAVIAGDDRDACEKLRRRLETAPRRDPARVTRLRTTSGAKHVRAIATALEHIARGDIYQVNLARRWRGDFQGSPLTLFGAMRDASPVPLGMFFEDEARSVLACTMERFLAWDGTTLRTRPIKGTVPRGEHASGAELAHDPKERAEHAMIVDLMRNDLSRVAKTGTVRVVDPMRVEPYAKLAHLVSEVACETRPDATLRAVLEATFPPGSVTGTPKVRAIEIIDALEAVPRGVYTGATGYIDRRGGCSLAVAIRTAVVEDGQVSYFAGGGIVEASVPEKELAETELKARVFLDAIAALSQAPLSAST